MANWTYPLTFPKALVGLLAFWCVDNAVPCFPASFNPVSFAHKLRNAFFPLQIGKATMVWMRTGCLLFKRNVLTTFLAGFPLEDVGSHRILHKEPFGHPKISHFLSDEKLLWQQKKITKPGRTHRSTTFWHSWGFVEIRGDSWGFVEIRGDSWRFVGHSWRFVGHSWRFVGRTYAYEECTLAFRKV